MSNIRKRVSENEKNVGRKQGLIGLNERERYEELIRIRRTVNLFPTFYTFITGKKTFLKLSI